MKQLLFKRKARFITYFIACFFPTIADLLRVGLISLILTAVQKEDLQLFYTCLYLSIALIIYEFISYVTSRLLRISYMRDTILDVRIAAMDKILNMSYKNFTKKSKDVYISNLINDVNNFEQNFFINLLNFIYSSATYIASAVLITLIDYRISLIIIGASLLIFVLTKLLEKKTNTLHQKVSQGNEEYTTNLSNTLNGLEILKLNNIESKFFDNSLNQIDKLERNKLIFNFFANSQMTITRAIGSFILIGSMIYLMTQVQYGVGYGDIALIVMLAGNMTFGLMNIFPRINVIKSSNNIYKKIALEENIETEIEKVNPFIFTDKIEVKDLDFYYDDKLIFDKASCIIEKNKKYLIKGVSGAGKTTLINILTNSYTDYQGLITVDGQNLKTINEDSYSKQMAFIYQDVFLFEDSLKNNITLYKRIKDDKISKAIEESGLSELVEELPEGINHVLSENGKNLSGGQRQRVSIARAIAKEANLLFVDEGTSSLNMELGKKIEETFLNFSGTVLSISHRYYEGVSNKYDYVLEIKNGKINTYTGKEYFQEDIQYV